MAGSNTVTESPWFRRFHPVGTAPARLVLFPHAGGSASYYLDYSAALSPYADVLVVQYPGRQNRFGEPTIDSIGGLADRIHEALQPRADRPLTFFGHSMGSAVCFEVARRFEAEGRDVPAHLFVSGGRAPSLPRDTSYHLLPDNELLAELARLGGTDERVLAEPELRELILPSVRSDYTAVETYLCAPDAVVSSPITALIGDEDARVSSAQARDWERHTTGAFDLRVFPGGHFYLADQRAAVVDLLATHLRR
ncbi:thioesterase [Streptomyces sp. CB01881]|uniref:thioesterase II family protein n=1 Tax=Streptomyces sp. CB01881 TaxID=2078691 RepID=UPI0011DF6D47|nr:alpha/beta fold hydrolase [Streptomyces sp. CB01881]TYC68230.1 thioesterase [Streptomyces sp. CB01881]